MAPFLHTLSRPYDVYLMWTYWPWLGPGESWSRAESVTTQPFFKYFPIKPTWHHNSSPSCLCSCIFLHDESIQSIQSLTPERRQASNPESNPFVVGSGRTFFVHAESTVYLSPLNISCTNKANGTGQQDHPRHRSQKIALRLTALSKEEAIVDWAWQFLSPLWHYLGAFMQKDECRK